MRVQQWRGGDRATRRRRTAAHQCCRVQISKTSGSASYTTQSKPACTNVGGHRVLTFKFHAAASASFFKSLSKMQRQKLQKVINLHHLARVSVSPNFTIILGLRNDQSSFFAGASLSLKNPGLNYSLLYAAVLRHLFDKSTGFTYYGTTSIVKFSFLALT